MVGAMVGFLEMGLGTLRFGSSPDEVAAYLGRQPDSIDEPDSDGLLRWEFWHLAIRGATFLTRRDGLPRMVELEAVDPSLTLEEIQLINSPLDKAYSDLINRGLSCTGRSELNDGVELSWFTRGVTLLSERGIVEEFSWGIIPESLREDDFKWPGPASSAG